VLSPPGRLVPRARSDRGEWRNDLAPVAAALFRSALVTAQIALSLALMVSADPMVALRYE